MEVANKIVCSEKKVSFITSTKCDDCYLARGVSVEDLYNSVTKKFDFEIVSPNSFFDLSTNLVFCSQHEDSEDIVTLSDLYYSVNDDFVKSFNSDEEISKISFEDVIVARNSFTTAIFFLIKEIEQLQGNYTVNSGSKKHKFGKFNLKAIHKPDMFNSSHFEVHIFGDHDGSLRKLDKDSESKGLIRRINAFIKSAIVQHKLVFESPGKRILRY